MKIVIWIAIIIWLYLLLGLRQQNLGNGFSRWSLRVANQRLYSLAMFIFYLLIFIIPILLIVLVFVGGD
jgi:hypothetical protein